jgi:formylglycine-generating enzyme required for sulfatase activity
MDDHDLERRRALEMLRHHARQSRPEAPSLLAASELRTLRAIPDVVQVVEREWRDRAPAITSADKAPWTPTSLVAHARAIHRRRRLVIGTAIGLALAGLVIAGGSWWSNRQNMLTNLGRFQLELAPFDWDAERMTAEAVPIADLPQLHWEIHDPEPSDPDMPSEEMSALVTLQSSEVSADGLTRMVLIDAPGRAAFLIIDHRGRNAAECSPSIIPLRVLPGYALRSQGPRLHIAVPTCQASAAGMINIPAGPFLSGGAGEPPSSYAAEFSETIEKDLPRYAIDRTEVTNAAWEPLNEMSAFTGIPALAYPASGPLHDAGKPRYPASGMPWRDARDYCRYMGKTLPTSDQWEKARRGGRTLASGARNAYPLRNFPWGARLGATAKLKDILPLGPAPVGTFLDDVSPEGVLDLAGNVNEWTLTITVDGDPRFRVVRGGDWEETDSAGLVDQISVLNTRQPNASRYSTGLRCVTNVPTPRESASL